MQLGHYILILTLWNVVMLFFSYAFYRRICEDMNSYLKIRRDSKRGVKPVGRKREPSGFSSLGDIVELNAEEEALLNSEH